MEKSMYEGGETKASTTGMQPFLGPISLAVREARVQPERRFRMVDAVLGLGYGRSGIMGRCPGVREVIGERNCVE